MSVFRSARDPRTLLVLVSLAAALLAACGKKEPPPAAKPPVEVTAVTVAPRDVPAVFEFVAQTQSSRQVNIQARVSGFLEKRVYTEGSMVKEGQVLFLMDAKPFQVQVDARRRRPSPGSRPRLEVARAEPRADEAADRAERALAEGPRRRHRPVPRTAAAARRGGEGPARDGEAQPVLLHDHSPRSTGISGAAAQQQDGTYISPQNSLLTTVAVLSPIWVNFSLSENEMQSFREQVDKGPLRRPPDGSYVVEVLLVDGSLFPHTGRITFAAPSFNAQTGTFLIRASVDNPDGRAAAEPVRARAR